MADVKVFDTAAADYAVLRDADGGTQAVCEWITPDDGHPAACRKARIRETSLIPGAVSTPDDRST